jgi:hypothetical protein
MSLNLEDFKLEVACREKSKSLEATKNSFESHSVMTSWAILGKQLNFCFCFLLFI